MLVKNRNFGQKFKFSENLKFNSNLKFSSNIEILINDLNSKISSILVSGSTNREAGNEKSEI